jgi:hypothetical protein
MVPAAAAAATSGKPAESVKLAVCVCVCVINSMPTATACCLLLCHQLHITCKCKQIVKVLLPSEIAMSSTLQHCLSRQLLCGVGVVVVVVP